MVVMVLELLLITELLVWKMALVMMVVEEVVMAR